MEGLDNPRFYVGRQSQATNSVHRLLKSAHALLLNWVAPAGPLSVNSKISGSDLDRRKETGTPGLLQLVLSVSTIAYDHRFLGVHLHVGLSQGFENALVTITQVMRKVRSGGDQDHVIDVLTHFDMPPSALQ
eukprot:5995294-Amphidinium_carterae.1